MKNLLLIILMFSSINIFSQVGINTTQPTKTLDVNGEQRIRIRPQGAITDSILVTNSLGEVRRLHINQLIQSSNNTCPDFVRTSSTGQYLLFSSLSSIQNPNNSIVIQGKNFVSAGTWINNNTYYYSYTSTNGAININNSFTVNFGTTPCNYAP